MMKRNASSLLLCVALAGCATYLDPNYAVQIEAYRQTVAAQKMVEVEKAKAEAARYDAIAAIAAYGDAATRGMALVALALAGRDGSSVQQVNVAIPQAPERQEDRAFKWAALFAAPVATLAQGYFTYRLGVTQSNNATNASIASYNALGATAAAGFGANQGIAAAGFGTAQGIATAGFSALAQMRPPTPNITFNGTGVVAGGNGSYVGPNSGHNSGNTGRISSPDDNHSTCTPAAGVPC
mgnify:CR=1 FL=1